MYYVYVLQSLDYNKLYVGQTNNLKHRLREHTLGKTQTTSRYGKLKLIFYEAFLDKEDSLRREKYFKTSRGKSSLRQIIRASIIKE